MGFDSKLIPRLGVDSGGGGRGAVLFAFDGAGAFAGALDDAAPGVSWRASTEAATDGLILVLPKSFPCFASSVKC